MKLKIRLKIPRSRVMKFAAAALVFLLSLLVLRFYTGGDQSIYRKVYETLPRLDLRQGFLFYSSKLTSQEYIHFFLSWVASRFVDKDLFIAFSNAILAYVVMSLFQKWRLSLPIALTLVLTNFYFWVLYSAAERLKFGFIFLALSLLNIERLKRFYGFTVLAIMSHVGVLVIYVSLLFNGFVRQVLKLFNTGRISKSALFFVPFLFVPLLVAKEQIFTKFQHWYGYGSLMEIGKSLVFLILALWYSRKRSETFIVFIPIIIAAFLASGGRINIFGYFVFLYYGSQFRRGWNFGVLAMTVYFACSSIRFLVNVIQHGHGFFIGN